MGKSDMRLLYYIMVEYYDCAFRTLKTRRRDVVEKKMMFAAVARKFGAKYWDIADYMGWVSHATAIHSVRRIGGYIDVYPTSRREFQAICERFQEELEYRESVGMLLYRE
jgi:hypothetical protein